MAAFLRRLRARIKYWNNAEELKKELDAHRAMTEATVAAGGASADESRWQAARLLGNTTLAREDARAVWVARWVEQGIQDVRYALRGLAREWGFAATATITFALGLGVLIGVFTVFNAVYLRQWPVRAPDEVFGVTTFLRTPLPGNHSEGGRLLSYSVWAAARAEMTTADLAARRDINVTMRPNEGGPGQSGRIGLVSDNFLETVGIGLQLGSLRSSTGLPAIAIADSVWRSAYGRDPSVIGKTIWLNDTPAIITGVLERRFRGFPPELSAGLMRIEAAVALKDTREFITNPRECCVEITGRIRPGHTRAEAGAELEGRANPRQAALGLPEVRAQTSTTALASRPGGVRETLPALFALLFAGCGVVTLLACANIGNLHLARGLRRRREMAVRLSLGAARSRIVRQLLTEGLVLAVVGTAGGLIIAWTVPPAVMTIDDPSSLVVTPDGAVIAFAATLAVVVTLLSALAPALRATQIDPPRASSNIASGGKLRGALLATQVALSLGLVASAALLSRGVMKVAGGDDAGFRFEGISSVTTASTTSAARAAVIDALQAVPGIALADSAPWSGRIETAQFHTPTGNGPISVKVFGLNRNAASLLELPLLSGRWPNDDKRLKEAVVSQSAATFLWPDNAALGRTILKTGEEEPYSVVGLMDDVRLAGAVTTPTIVLARRSRSVADALVSAGGEAEIVAAAKRADPEVRTQVTPLVAGLRRQLRGSILGMSIASGLGLVALLLASLGVFGVFAYVVEERRREIGVRLALGATRAQIRRSILGTTRWPVIAGLTAGLGLAVAGGFMLRSNLYGLSVLDPLSYLVVAVILSGAALAATSIPLRRALRVDPAITLRAD